MSQDLEPVTLNREAFAPYGDVIEASDAVDSWLINEDHTRRYNNLARVDVTADNGKPRINIFRSNPVANPIQIRLMERHPLSSQAFMPLSGRPYLVVVARPGTFDPAGITAFIASPGQGVNYHAGTWHHYCLALYEESDFLVVDRGGEEKNCDEVLLEIPLLINLTGLNS